MTATIQQTSYTTASSPATVGSAPLAQASTVLAAFNAVNIASSYIERGNFAAARRKLTQALTSINQLAEG